MSSLALTETALSKFANKDTEVWTGGPYQQYDVINTQNRESVLTLLLQSYNADIANLSPWSRDAFCRSCLRIAGSGFKQFSGHLATVGPHTSGLRISVTPGLLVEMLSGVYFCIFNGHMKLGVSAMDAIHARASYELYSDVLLVTNAIRNSLKHVTQDEDDVMGISVSAMTSASSGVCKAALTNASFRALKLPEDISVPGLTAQSKSLPVIEEKVSDPASPKPALVKGKMGKALGRRADKGRAVGNVNANSSDVADSTVSVVVAKKYTRTPVDSIELSNMNANAESNGSETNAPQSQKPTPDKSTDVDGESGKPRSSSLNSAVPMSRNIVSRFSSHSINPASTHTQL